MQTNPIVSQKSESKKDPISISNLFKKSYKFFKKNIKNLLVITLVALIPILILQLMLERMLPKDGNFENMGMMMITAFIIFFITIVVVLFSILQQIALIYFINKKNSGEEISLKEFFTAAKKYFISYLWINILIFLISIVGIIGILFSTALSTVFKIIFASKFIVLIFIILSFILAMTIFFYLFYLLICFVFSSFILLCDNIKGWEALKKSRELVKGSWWSVLIKTIILNLLFFILSLLNFFIKLIPLKNLSGILGTFYSFIFSLFAIPFTVIYFYFIYKDLRG